MFDDEGRAHCPDLAGMLRLSEFLERGRSQVSAGRALPSGPAQRLAADLRRWRPADTRIRVWDASRNLDVLQRSLNLQVELVSGVWLGEERNS